MTAVKDDTTRPRRTDKAIKGLDLLIEYLLAQYTYCADYTIP